MGVSPEAGWSEVERWFVERLSETDDALDEALRASEAAGLPAISVSPAQGRLLHILARMQGATAILEIGTLGGYSTIWLARALSPGGRLVTLEIDPRHAGVARANVERAGLGAAVDIRVGPALETLASMADAAEGPFDFIFIDADKESIPAYFDRSVKLARPGAVIVVDNVVRGGAVVDAASTDPSVQGVRRFIDEAGADPRVITTAIQTVGAKGYDGFAIAFVKGAAETGPLSR
jgi:predicted O-methyltransferase YrrM